MKTQNTVARIAGISVPFIIGVGLLAAGAPFVVGTLWVLLVGLALLVTWWLVLNLLGGVAEKTPAPIARIRGRHRVRLLIKAEKTAPLQAALAKWVGQLKQPGTLRLSIDIDPQSFY